MTVVLIKTGRDFLRALAACISVMMSQGNSENLKPFQKGHKKKGGRKKGVPNKFSGDLKRILATDWVTLRDDRIIEKACLSSDSAALLQLISELRELGETQGSAA